MSKIDTFHTRIDKLEAQINYLVDRYAWEGLHAPRSKEDERSFEDGRAMRRGDKALPAYADGWNDVMRAGGYTYEDRQIRMRARLAEL